MFLSHKPFQRFKHAVIKLGEARHTEQESAAWQSLLHTRLQALWYACIPAWAAAVAKSIGLELPVVVLLALATPVLFGCIARLANYLDGFVGCNTQLRLLA